MARCTAAACRAGLAACAARRRPGRSGGAGARTPGAAGSAPDARVNSSTSAGRSTARLGSSHGARARQIVRRSIERGCDAAGDTGGAGALGRERTGSRGAEGAPDAGLDRASDAWRLGASDRTGGGRRPAGIERPRYRLDVRVGRAVGSACGRAERANRNCVGTGYCGAESSTYRAGNRRWYDDRQRACRVHRARRRKCSRRGGSIARQGREGRLRRSHRCGDRHAIRCRYRRYSLCAGRRRRSIRKCRGRNIDWTACWRHILRDRCA